MLKKIDNYFGITEKGSSFRTEIIAGLTTFATMAYILVVQAIYMGDAGMNMQGVVIGTALMSALFTAMSALYSKAPFALAPAMGSNAVMAYTVVGSGMATWQVGLGIFVCSGILLILLSLLKVREKMVNVMPKNIKIGCGAAVGVFLSRLACSSAGIFTPDFSGLGDFTSPTVQLFLIGMVITIILGAIRIEVKGRMYQLRGYMLVSILLTTAIGIPMGVVAIPESFIDFNFSAFGEIVFKADPIGVFKNWATITMLVFLTLDDFLSTTGTTLGCGNKAGMLDEDGNMPGISRIFLTDATGTAVGAIFGITNMQTYVESAAGIEAGGRTGMTALTTAFMFLLSAFFSPVFLMIPSAATSPALIMIGVSMLQALKDVDFEALEWAPIALMIFIAAFIGDFIMGVALGIIVHVITHTFYYVFTKDRSKMPSFGTYVLAVVMALYFLT